jgi:hypothetical protein
MEQWNNGTMEQWNNGTMEQWNNGTTQVLKERNRQNTPTKYIALPLPAWHRLH